MKATLLKVKKVKSYYGEHFFYGFFKGEDGKSYKTCVDTKNANYQRWKKFIQRSENGEKIFLDKLSLFNSKIVDADSCPIEITGEREVVKTDIMS